MTAKILGGLAAAVLVVGVGLFAAGNGSFESLGLSSDCSSPCPLSSGSCSQPMPESSCCSLSNAATADETTQAEAAEGTCEVKKACCSEKSSN